MCKSQKWRVFVCEIVQFEDDDRKNPISIINLLHLNSASTNTFFCEIDFTKKQKFYEISLNEWWRCLCLPKKLENKNKSLLKISLKMLFSQSFFMKNIRDKIDFTKKMFLTSSLGNLISDDMFWMICFFSVPIFFWIQKPSPLFKSIAVWGPFIEKKPWRNKCSAHQLYKHNRIVSFPPKSSYILQYLHTQKYNVRSIPKKIKFFGIYIKLPPDKLEKRSFGLIDLHPSRHLFVCFSLVSIPTTFLCRM